MSHSQSYVANLDPTVPQTIDSLLEEVTEAQKKLVDDERKMIERLKTNQERNKKLLFDGILKQILDRKSREIIVFKVPKEEPDDAKEFVMTEIIKAFSDKADIYVLFVDPKNKNKYIYSQVSSKLSNMFDMKHQVELYAIEYRTPKTKIFTAITGQLDYKYVKNISK